MTLTETNIYWIFTAQGREYHYPKAVWSKNDAEKHLADYFEQVANFDKTKKKR